MKNRGQRKFLCPLFLPIPHRPCGCLKSGSVGDRHAVPTCGAMAPPAGGPASRVLRRCRRMFILRIEQQVPRLYLVPFYVHTVGVLLHSPAALPDHIRAAAGVVECPVHEAGTSDTQYPDAGCSCLLSGCRTAIVPHLVVQHLGKMYATNLRRGLFRLVFFRVPAFRLALDYTFS